MNSKISATDSTTGNTDPQSDVFYYMGNKFLVATFDIAKGTLKISGPNQDHHYKWFGKACNQHELHDCVSETICHAFNWEDPNVSLSSAAHFVEEKHLDGSCDQPSKGLSLSKTLLSCVGKEKVFYNEEVLQTHKTKDLAKTFKDLPEISKETGVPFSKMQVKKIFQDYHRNSPSQKAQEVMNVLEKLQKPVIVGMDFGNWKHCIIIAHGEPVQENKEGKLYCKHWNWHDNLNPKFIVFTFSEFQKRAVEAFYLQSLDSEIEDYTSWESDPIIYGNPIEETNKTYFDAIILDHSSSEKVPYELTAGNSMFFNRIAFNPMKVTEETTEKTKGKNAQLVAGMQPPAPIPSSNLQFGLSRLKRILLQRKPKSPASSRCQFFPKDSNGFTEWGVTLKNYSAGKAVELIGMHLQILLEEGPKFVKLNFPVSMWDIFNKTKRQSLLEKIAHSKGESQEKEKFWITTTEDYIRFQDWTNIYDFPSGKCLGFLYYFNFDIGGTILTCGLIRTKSSENRARLKAAFIKELAQIEESEQIEVPNNPLKSQEEEAHEIIEEEKEGEKSEGNKTENQEIIEVISK